MNERLRAEATREIPENEMRSPEYRNFLESRTGETVLETVHLGIQFGGLKAVDDFNMDIKAGELVGLIGPNGAGKTTVFNMLTGVYQPTEGTVSLCGQVMNGKKAHQFVHAGIARTFQNIRLFSGMSVLDNVKVAMSGKYRYGFAGALFHTPKYRKIERERDAAARELLSIFHLEDKADLDATQVSDGKKVRCRVHQISVQAQRYVHAEPVAR